MGNPVTPAAKARDVIAATRQFAKEQPARSWWVLATTMVILLGLLAIAAIAPWWPLALAASLCGSLVMVRGFILFHDYKHGAIFRNSKIVRPILNLYGMLFLTAPKYWRETHNFHHAHVSNMRFSSTGSYPVMTKEMWQKAGRLERLNYRAARHPLTYAFAYLTVFLISNTIEPFIRSPRKNWSSGAALLVHGGLIAGLWLLGGFWTAFFAFLLPYTIAGAFGAYLFYVQHNFAGMKILPEDEWNMFDASLVSTSYLKLDPILDWCTGSIGYHHVHHLNAAIPFYRLKEAHKAIPELQQVPTVRLTPRDIWQGLRQKVWDPEQGRMLTFKEARN